MIKNKSKIKTYKIKSIIEISRHGARSSGEVGRKDDYKLCLVRQGLSFIGFAQNIQSAQITSKRYELNKYFEHKLSKFRVFIYSTTYQRAERSSYGYAVGLCNYGMDFHFDNVEEKSIAGRLPFTQKFGKIY